MEGGFWHSSGYGTLPADIGGKPHDATSAFKDPPTHSIEQAKLARPRTRRHDATPICRQTSGKKGDD